jgi:hypothetical protein
LPELDIYFSKCALFSKAHHFFSFAVLGIALYMQGKCCTIDPSPREIFANIFKQGVLIHYPNKNIAKSAHTYKASFFIKVSPDLPS